MMKAVVFAVAAIIATTIGARAAQQASGESLGAACVREAQTSHAKAWRLEPSLRPTIEGQRARMAAACTSLASARGSVVADALAACLSEAGQGPRHIQRGRDMDRAHIARQREICRALAAQAN